MTQLPAARVLVDILERQNVSDVFGLIGSAGMEVFDALYDSESIRFIGVRDERTGTHMADGYARASGKAGVILAGQNGPGATNLVTGLAQAKAAYSPVVALAGSLSSGHVYRDAFQEVDQQALFAPVTKKTWTVTQASRIGEMIEEAFRTALTGRPGPVVVNLPRDILSELVEETKPRAPVNYSGIGAGRPDQISAAAKALVRARRPVILAGGGVKNGRSHMETLALAELLGAPVVTSPGHGDALPFGSSLNAGQAGPRGNEVASSLLREADVILALGSRLGFNTTFYSADNVNTEATIIQVELEASAIGRFFDAEIGIHGDARLAAMALKSAIENIRGPVSVPESDWLKSFRNARAEYLSKRDSENEHASDPIQPGALFKAMRDVFPEDVMVTMDAGTLCLQATDRLNYHQPPALFTPLDFGLVGFSYACGLGAKLAQPERTVVSLMGDGGFGMAHSEIGTAVSEGINTVTVVMNNGCWGAEKAYQRDFFGERYLGADVANPPYDKLAELWGARGFRIDRAADMADVLAEAIAADAPAIVDVSVDPNALYSFRRDSFAHRAK